jgi:kynurenine formamidase
MHTHTHTCTHAHTCTHLFEEGEEVDELELEAVAQGGKDEKAEAKGGSGQRGIVAAQERKEIAAKRVFDELGQVRSG